MSRNAKSDDNGYPTIFGISCVDGITPVRVVFTVNGMLLDTVTTISVVPSPLFPDADDNDKNVAKGVSSADHKTVLPWYVNPATGAVLATTT